MSRRTTVVVTDHAIERYIERAFPYGDDLQSSLYHHQQAAAADPASIRALLIEQLHLAQDARWRGQELIIPAHRMGKDGHLYKYFYLRFVTPQRVRVFLAVDEKLRKVYTVLTLDQFINSIEHRA